MIHILLTILKIIGIILLVLLGILLILVLVVLFVPIRYRVKGHKEEVDLVGKIRVSWLFGLVAFIGSYQEKNMQLQWKVFGINLLELLKKCKKKTSRNRAFQRENADKLEKIENTKKNKDATAVSSEAAVQQSTETLPIENELSKPLWDKIKEIFGKIIALPSKVMARIRKIRLTIESIYDKMSYWKNFLADEKTKSAILIVKDEVLKILRHVLPKKLTGQIVYGFEDPCTTGQVLAGISAIYPVYYKHLSISPDFSGAVFTGNVELKGRIYIVYLVKSALIIFLNKNIQYIIHTFRNKEES